MTTRTTCIQFKQHPLYTLPLHSSNGNGIVKKNGERSNQDC